MYELYNTDDDDRHPVTDDDYPVQGKDKINDQFQHFPRQVVAGRLVVAAQSRPCIPLVQFV